MINRVLIRNKVVQLLYSYLLVNNNFSLCALSDSPQHEERFAHRLYLDMLVLMVRISESITKRGQGKPLADTRFIRRLRENDQIRALLTAYSRESFPYEHAVSVLSDIIKESGIYKLYLKDLQNENGVRDDQVWQDLFKNIISVDPSVIRVASAMPRYTLRAYERMEHMMEQTFRSFYSASPNLSEALRELQRSLSASRSLYFNLLQLPIAITDLRDEEIEKGRRKYIKTPEDINPDMRLADNLFVKALRENAELADAIKERGINWLDNSRSVVRNLLKSIMDSDLYKDYVALPATDFRTDSEFWRDAMRDIVFNNDALLEELENKSVFWNDDLFVIGDFVLKTIRRFWDVEKAGEGEECPEPILEMYKDEVDARFGAELFEYVVRNREYYRSLINENVNHLRWDAERIAYMDVVIVMCALAELLNYPEIPVSATVNEYVEIAKYYSTPNSARFVHGLLGALINRLREEKVLQK